MRIADGIHRLGTDSIVNSYLVDDGGAVTIVDAGVPGLYDAIPRELEQMGRTVADVKALLLTHGHSANALFVGDAICTYAVTTGRRGPQIAPFTADGQQALASLDRLAAIEAGLILPGHGDAWTGGAAEAVRLARVTAA